MLNYKKLTLFTEETIKASNLSDNLKHVLLSDKKCAFYGAGLQAVFLLDFFVLINKDVVCTIVSDKKSANDTMFERKKLPVISVEEFAENYHDDVSVVLSLNNKYQAEVCDALRKHGIDDICSVSDWHLENREIERITKVIRIFMLENNLICRVINPLVSVQGESFKTYLIENNMPEKIAPLKRSLDAKSLKVIDRCLFKILQNPEDWLAHYWLLSVPEFENALMPKEFRETLEKCVDNAKRNHEDLALFNIGIEARLCEISEEFLYHHGLFLADAWIKNYIAERDFLDCGSFDGISAYIFHKYYKPKKIYSFDLSEKNNEIYMGNMQKAGISKEKFELIRCGVSNHTGQCNLIDSGGAGMSIGRFSTQNEKGALATPLVKIDDFVKSRNGIDVGYVKFDIEGHGLAALQGMEETIKRFRPVMNLAIYHSPTEFFEMKPLLDDFVKDLNYRIEIVDNNNSCYEMQEICLFAYPEH